MTIKEVVKNSQREFFTTSFKTFRRLSSISAVGDICDVFLEAEAVFLHHRGVILADESPVAGFGGPSGDLLLSGGESLDKAEFIGVFLQPGVCGGLSEGGFSVVSPQVCAEAGLVVGGARLRAVGGRRPGAVGYRQYRLLLGDVGRFQVCFPEYGVGRV